MVDKKKFHGGLKVLLSLLFIMLLGLFSTSFAVDYNDFDIPLEFWDELILYINNNVSSCPRGRTTSITSSALKNFYDTNIKSLLKTQIENLGGDDRNILIVIRNYLDNPTTSSQRLYIGFLYNNNTINNIENMRTFSTAAISSPYSYTSYSLSYRYQAPIIYQMRIYNDNTIDLNQASNLGSDTLAWIYNENNIQETSGSAYIINNGPFFGVNQMPLNVVNANLPYNSTDTDYFINGFYNINYVEPEPEPEEPSGDTGTGSTGTITNPSGEVTGQIDLSGIENGIKDIKDTISGEAQAIRDTISGETGKVINTLTDVPDLSNTEISSGDIKSALGFEFMADPYDNFWLQMIMGLSGALTNSVRKIPINWLGYNGYFDLDELNFNYPEPIRNILTAVSTVSMVWLLVKWWKIIIDKLSSGDIDEVLAMNEEERYY